MEAYLEYDLETMASDMSVTWIQPSSCVFPTVFNFCIFNNNMPVDGRFIS